MSDEARKRRAARILAEAHALLAAAPEPYVPAPEPLRYRLYDPADSEPEPPPKLDIDIDARIAQAIAKEREVLLAIMAEAIGGTLRRALSKERREQKADLEDEVRKLRIELTNLQETLGELHRSHRRREGQDP